MSWRTTPILSDVKWANWRLKDDEISEASVQKIQYYLDQYGFGFPIPPDISSEINTAISPPRSFYAYGRIGVIIVHPQNRKVFFAYAG